MFCKFCGEILTQAQTKCSRCGKEVPKTSDCGGFYQVMPSAAGRVSAAPRQPEIPGRAVPAQNVAQATPPAPRKPSALVLGMLGVMAVMAVFMIVMMVQLGSLNGRLKATEAALQAHLEAESAETEATVPTESTAATDPVETTAPTEETTAPAEDAADPTTENTAGGAAEDVTGAVEEEPASGGGVSTEEDQG